MLLMIMIFLFQLLIMWPLSFFNNQVDLNVRVVDEHGNVIPNARIFIRTTKSEFPFINVEPIIAKYVTKEKRTNKDGIATLVFNCRYGRFYFSTGASGYQVYGADVELKHGRRWDLTTKLLERKKDVTIVLKKKDKTGIGE